MGEHFQEIVGTYNCDATRTKEVFPVSGRPVKICGQRVAILGNGVGQQVFPCHFRRVFIIVVVYSGGGTKVRAVQRETGSRFH